jgi:hypothetical protein
MINTLLSALVLFSAQASLPSTETIRADLRHEGGKAKIGNYIADGFFAGGDKAVITAKLNGIRRAQSKEGYERIVFDLESVSGKVPYYQVQVIPSEHRLVISFWTNLDYDFNSTKVQKLFTKSKTVKKLNVVPRVEEGLSIVEMVLDKKSKVETFTLTNPSRLIVDIL